MSLRKLLAELKRRRVFRVAGLYIVSGVAVIEAASALIPMLDLPASLGKGIVVLVLLGLPLALGLAWAFDITGEGVKPTGPAEAHPGATTDPERLLPIVLLGALLVIVVSLAAYGRYSAHAGAGDGAPGTAMAPSLAVLPLANLSSDTENEYFADGMTEELIAALSRVKGLRVVSRTSSYAFKGRNADIRQVGQELGVATILEGSVRKAGNQLRIVVQLVDTRNGYQLWSDQYTRKLADVFAVQEEISRAVVGALAAQPGLVGAIVPADSPARRGTDDVDAYEFYLRGRYLTNKWSHENVRRGIAYFERAIEKDPRFARAYAGLADAYMWLLWDGSVEDALPKARETARRALELDDSLSEAHYAVARIASEIDWDWSTAEKEFRRALKLDPTNGEARHRYAHLLLALGRDAAATTESRKLLDLDPLNAEWHHHLGWNYLFSRQYALAEAPYRKALELDPNVTAGWAYLGILFVKQGRFSEAIQMFEEDINRHGSNGETLSNLAWGYAMAGNIASARATLAQSDRRRISIPAWRRAYIYASLGEKDEAFKWLERAFVERRALFQFVRDPRFDPLRDDPRFGKFVQRMKLSG